MLFGPIPVPILIPILWLTAPLCIWQRAARSLVLHVEGICWRRRWWMRRHARERNYNALATKARARSPSQRQSQHTEPKLKPKNQNQKPFALLKFLAIKVGAVACGIFACWLFGCGINQLVGLGWGWTWLWALPVWLPNYAPCPRAALAPIYLSCAAAVAALLFHCN